MKTVIEIAREGVLSGEMTITEAAILLHEHGFTNFIDIDKTKRLLNL